MPALRAAAVSAALFSLTVLGCGGSGPYGVVSTKGVIKYDDGSLIQAERIELLFNSQEPAKDAKTHPRQGVAEVNVADGTFTPTTYEFGDGLIRGEHLVIAKSIKMGFGNTPAIPQKYHSTETTPLRIDAQGQFLELTIEKP